MKILHITTSSKGGAGIAALRLHNALCQNGIESAFISINLSINYKNEIIEDSFFRYKRPTFLGKLKQFFTVSERQKLENELKELEPKMQFEIATLPFSNYKIQNHPLFKEADIINLHWIDGILDYQSFFPNCFKPIVWTFHDMNPFLGIFHYHNDDAFNTKICNSFDSKIKKLKKNFIQEIQNGAFVTPSKWLSEEVNKINFFKGFQQHVISNAIDLEIFKIQDKGLLRKKYRIDNNEFVVLFVSDSLKNPRKGFDLLLESLKFLEKKNVSILIVGKGIVPIIDNLNIISLGEINSNVEMSECFALSDVYVLSSREDNLPNVMLESFACGTPMVGFKVGGIAEHVLPNITGLLANEVTGFALAEAIIKLKHTIENYKRETIRKYAVDNFNFKKQANSYMEAYTSIFNKYQNKH